MYPSYLWKDEEAKLPLFRIEKGHEMSTTGWSEETGKRERDGWITQKPAHVQELRNA